ncbi:MAG: adenylate kinase [Chloroflexi bacterium]|nr:adenylate kinase [Chloroflexota bacterium]
MQSLPYQRVVVIGSTSSGKSTLAKRLADTFGMDFIELDALHWEPNWTEAPGEIFRARVDKATRAECWALAGNYREVRDIVWPRAQAVIWLDYPFWTVFWQLTRRTFMRWWRRELLWGTNYENLWSHLKLWSEESLYNWLFKTYWRRKKEYPMQFSMPQHAHLKIIQLRSPKETEEWMRSVSSDQLSVTSV